jgi:hypothetical protein
MGHFDEYGGWHDGDDEIDDLDLDEIADEIADEIGLVIVKVCGDWR